MKTPKNIATMTEAEHQAWIKSLSDSEWDRMADKSFTVVEYQMRTVTADGDIMDMIGNNLLDSPSAFHKPPLHHFPFSIVVIE